MTIPSPSASPSAAMSGRSETWPHATQQMALISSGSLVALSSILSFIIVFLYVFGLCSAQYQTPSWPRRRKTPIPCAPHSPHSGQ